MRGWMQQNFIQLPLLGDITKENSDICQLSVREDTASANIDQKILFQLFFQVVCDIKFKFPFNFPSNCCLLALISNNPTFYTIRGEEELDEKLNSVNWILVN